MEKKKNNPWYYYNNGVLIKKRKPAMPGDLVLISRSFTINCIFTIVRDVYIGGFHDTQGRYFQWHDVFKASEVLNELTDLRNFKKNCDRYTELVSEDLKSEIDKLQDDLEFAWNQVHDSNQEVKMRDKDIERMEKQIKDLQEINGWLLSNYSTASKK